MGPVIVIGQTLVAGVFVVSAVGKVRDAVPSARFTATVFRLAGVPVRLARPALTAAVAGEFAVVVLLAAAWALPGAYSRLVTAGLILALVLLVGFSTALALAVRAEARTPCGCFGDPSAPPGMRHLVRNAVLVVAAAVGAWAAATGPALPVLSAQSVAAGAVGLGLVAVLLALDDLVALFSRPRRTVVANGFRRSP